MVGSSTRKLCRYPGTDVRAISEGIATTKQREKATERAGNGQTPLSLARTAESDEMKGGAGATVGMVTRYYAMGMYAGRFARMHIRALISFPQPACFFFRPSGDGIRARVEVAAS